MSDRPGYVMPDRGRLSFTCPHCGVFARQYQWGYDQERNANLRFGESNVQHAHFSASMCEHCNKICLWMGSEFVYPNRGSAPLPNPEMPPDAKADYEEAARIANASPRGAAALLRLAIQKLCLHLGGNGENINKDIALLVSRGLPVLVQQALDVVRVIGNNAVHPGQIDVDDAALVEKLFPLVNLITLHMIDLPKQAKSLYSALPDNVLDQIKKRDG